MPWTTISPEDLTTHVSVRGTYLLILRVPQIARLQVGRLGCYDIPVGAYTYIGSALGPGGLAARVGRHLRTRKRLHWHIDYLLDVANIQEVWGIDSEERLECVWAGRLLRSAGARVIVPHFGASDCDCSTHLIYWGTMPAWKELREELGIQWVIQVAPPC